MSIPLVRNYVVAINLKLFHFSFLKIIEIEFEMKLQSFFLWEFFQVLTNHDLSYLSPLISEWIESKLPMFIKIYTIRCNLFIF